MIRFRTELEAQEQHKIKQRKNKVLKQLRQYIGDHVVLKKDVAQTHNKIHTIIDKALHQRDGSTLALALVEIKRELRDFSDKVKPLGSKY